MYDLHYTCSIIRLAYICTLFLPFFPWTVYQLMAFWLQKKGGFFHSMSMFPSWFFFSISSSFFVFFSGFLNLFNWSPIWRNKITLLIMPNIQKKTNWNDADKQTLSRCVCLKENLYLYISWRIKCCDFSGRKCSIIRKVSLLQLRKFWHCARKEKDLCCKAVPTCSKYCICAVLLFHLSTK